MALDLSTVSKYKICNLKHEGIVQNDSKWLILSGALSPPNNIAVSRRRSKARNGNFLPGVAKDIANMEDALRSNNFHKFNTVKDDRLTKNEAIRKIKDLLQACGQKFQPVIYYTGHGEKGTGNWCFSDGTLGKKELMELFPRVYPNKKLIPFLICDCCYSGSWYLIMGVAALFSLPFCLPACGPDSTALDFADRGGEMTLYLTGKDDSWIRSDSMLRIFFVC